MFSICTYVAENEESLNLVEGERVYVIERHNSDWWFVKKNLTEEKGWVPSQYLMDEVRYTHYVQKKLHEKIDQLPVFESKYFDHQQLFVLIVNKNIQSLELKRKQSLRDSSRSWNRSERMMDTPSSLNVKSKVFLGPKSLGSDRLLLSRLLKTSRCTTTKIMLPCLSSVKCSQKTLVHLHAWQRTQLDSRPALRSWSSRCHFPIMAPI